jgi:hypothetical protein
MRKRNLYEEIVERHRAEVRTAALDLVTFLVRNIDGLHFLGQDARLRCEHLVGRIGEYQAEAARFQDMIAGKGTEKVLPLRRDP